MEVFCMNFLKRYCVVTKLYYQHRLHLLMLSEKDKQFVKILDGMTKEDCFAQADLYRRLGMLNRVILCYEIAIWKEPNITNVLKCKYCGLVLKNNNAGHFSSAKYFFCGGPDTTKRCEECLLREENQKI